MQDGLLTLAHVVGVQQLLFKHVPPLHVFALQSIVPPQPSGTPEPQSVAAHAVFGVQQVPTQIWLPVHDPQVRSTPQAKSHWPHPFVGQATAPGLQHELLKQTFVPPPQSFAEQSIVPPHPSGTVGPQSVAPQTVFATHAMHVLPEQIWFPGQFGQEIVPPQLFGTFGPQAPTAHVVVGLHWQVLSRQTSEPGHVLGQLIVPPHPSGTVGPQSVAPQTVLGTHAVHVLLVQTSFPGHAGHVMLPPQPSEIWPHCDAPHVACVQHVLLSQTWPAPHPPQ